MRITSGPVSKSLRFFDDDGKDISKSIRCCSATIIANNRDLFVKVMLECNVDSIDIDISDANVCRASNELG